MNKIYYFLFLFFLLFTAALSQDMTDTSDQGEQQETEMTDPARQQIIEIIKSVNDNYLELNDIKASGEIKVKTPKIDETADIEIKAKKKDDLWFHIDGPLGVDVAQAHFNRKRFTFYNALKDEVVTGTSSIINIGTLTKIRCTFDDLLNAFTGSVRIFRSKKDSLWMEDEGGQNMIALKRGTITRKYWVDKYNYSVSKYVYTDKRGRTLIQFEFSDFSTYAGKPYARRVEVRRPLKNEYFRLQFEEFNPGYGTLDFFVSFPSDVKRKNWR